MWEKRHAKTKELIGKHATPKYMILKAAVCAYLAGDRSLTKRLTNSKKSFRYDIRFYPDDSMLVSYFQNAFLALYGKKLKIKEESDGKYFTLKITNKIAALDLCKIGKFGALEWRVPFDFLTTSAMKKSLASRLF